MVSRALSQSNIGPIPVEERERMISESSIYGEYEESIDRVSAFESLQEAEEQEEAAKISNVINRPAGWKSISKRHTRITSPQVETLCFPTFVHYALIIFTFYATIRMKDKDRTNYDWGI